MCGSSRVPFARPAMIRKVNGMAWLIEIFAGTRFRSNQEPTSINSPVRRSALPVACAMASVALQRSTIVRPYFFNGSGMATTRTPDQEDQWFVMNTRSRWQVHQAAQVAPLKSADVVRFASTVTEHFSLRPFLLTSMSAR